MDLMGDYARRLNPGGGNPAAPQYNTGGNGQAMPSPMTGGYDKPSQFHPQMGGHMPPPFMPQMPGYDSSGINPHGMYTGGNQPPMPMQPFGGGRLRAMLGFGRRY
jgi:hypothetical protein